MSNTCSRAKDFRSQRSNSLSFCLEPVKPKSLATFWMKRLSAMRDLSPTICRTRNRRSLFKCTAAILISFLLTGLKISGAGALNDSDTTQIEQVYGAAPKADLSILRSPLRDLRWNFCTSAVIERRKSQRLCLVDIYGILLGKGDSTAKTREVLVTERDTVQSILEKAGVNRWRGGQPQIRLLAQDLIAQSPFGALKDRQEEIRRFLELPVRPGDVLVVAAVE
jgi:hypothetical protein